ncbi:type 1 fimbrial protein [Stenotrophomonas sp. CFBP 13718]|nr:type 1 fimbrial protein [Stenotrophomonas sp. CFBP 13718]MBD8695682.1 type 1 fimbrial protein [Stenotrophomonas sp. CFBP 13718]
MLLAAALFGVSPISRADSATLTISGRVDPGTCTLVASAVVLDPIRVDQLRQGDNALKASTLQLNNCVGVTTATLSFDGTEADRDAQRWKNTAVHGPASGLAVSLLSGTAGTTYLKRGDRIPVTVTGTSAKLDIRSGYYLAVAAGVSAGSVSTEVTITAEYK